MNSSLEGKVFWCVLPVSSAYHKLAELNSFTDAYAPVGALRGASPVEQLTLFSSSTPFRVFFVVAWSACEVWIDAAFGVEDNYR